MYFYLALALLLGIQGEALATTVTAEGGLSVGRNSGLNAIKNPSPVAGVDYTFDEGSHFDLGGFFNHNWENFNDGGAGSINFMGLLLRYHFGDGLSQHSGLFTIGRIGASQVSGDNNSTSTRLGYGGGLGYDIPLGKSVSFGPQAEGRMIQTSASQGTDQAQINVTMGLSIHF